MSKDLILFATADWAEQYWTNKQRMADQFSDHGFRVLYVESFGLRSPGTNKKDLKRLFRRLWSGLRPAKKIKNNLWVLSPLLIPRWQNATIAKLNYFLLTAQLKLFKLFHQFQSDLIWTYHPYVEPLLKPLNAKKVYYHVVDNITAVPNVDAKSYHAVEEKFLSQVTAIFVTSVPLKDYYESLSKKIPVYYSPNVVDVDHFAKARVSQKQPNDMQSIPRPRLLYYGVLSDFKIDVELLITIAQQRTEWELIFIGDEREGQDSQLLQALKNLPNVHFLGYRAYADLPPYLSAVNVGILPLLDNSYTRYMFPMKFFEFLAAGLPVVSTRLNALVPYQNLFSVADNAYEFITAIECSLCNKKQGLSIEEMEAQYSWKARMKQVLEII
ncbi:MAG: glycosyltransferase [Gammaproteobacteria bacterium]|nr:glycosyltransferase [Gammaproteobacteria bacterium]